MVTYWLSGDIGRQRQTLPAASACVWGRCANRPLTGKKLSSTPLLSLIDRIILPCAALDPPDGLDLGVQALQVDLQGWSRSSTIGEVISKCHFE